MGTFLIILIIAFVIFMIIGATTKPPSTEKVNNNVKRKEIEINLKEFPNEYTFSVKGVHLSDYSYPIFNICKEFDLITLVPEPDNSFDSDAIKVVNSGWDIGYVPAEETYEVHQIIKKENISYIETLNISGYISVIVKIRYKN
ncbi:HIRAN domain-containing protein [Flavobacterium granuli]|uniref:HIRAN domain-containing protein n=1 Tax=Flavobacterium granuli TaxID=280093 RepID=A0ABU1S0I3_9FLAO|nr:HIRAN domain-containing protein [Flavobacterium granuli]MDR6844532.1 hypothetical protein [Flavobacterium granuli]